jgi:hypothetical protein
MGVLFESRLLFSLAVLIILMGLLVYYFKKRIVEVEQKNASCLEIVQDVYTQHMTLRNEMYSLLAYQPSAEHPPLQPKQMVYYHNEEDRDDRIKIVLSEDDDESDEDMDDESDEDMDDESDDDVDDVNEQVVETPDDDKIKVVSVDLTFDEAVEINVDEDDVEEIEDEPELKSLESVDAPIVVNKVGPPQITKEELKKLTPSALKSLLIGKGVPADKVSKMKKNELVEKLLEENV